MSLDGAIRLTGGKQNYSGVVQVYVDGLWLGVCEKQWNNNNARVVCRQLGFDTGFAIPGNVVIPLLHKIYLYSKSTCSIRPILHTSDHLHPLQG